MISKVAEAQKLFERALEIVGNDHPDTIYIKSKLKSKAAMRKINSRLHIHK